jgi:catechol 2,3-dioxygenase-like lactoylglutathione lyase family enzyme
MNGMAFTRTIPALPVRDIAAATAFYAGRLGFTVVFADDGFARLVRDDAEIHLWAADDSAWAASLWMASTRSTPR